MSEFDPVQSVGGSHNDLDAETGFSAVKKQILGTSLLQLFLILLEIAVIIWYVFIPEESVGQFILALVILFGGVIGISILQTKVSRIKKRKFKTYVVREALARKCRLHSYRHKNEELEGLLPSLVVASGASGQYQYVLSDYLNGTYHGYKFRMLDYEARYNDNRGTNVHLLAIELGRRLEGDTYIHLSELPRFFGAFVEDEAYDKMPFFSIPKLAKRVHVLKFKKEGDRAPAPGALNVTETWEHDVGVKRDDNAHDSSAKLTYRPDEILTEEMGNVLADEFVNRKWLHVHFEDDLLLISYAERKDLFEPHFWYGFMSREKVEAKVDVEVNTSFEMFDRMLPVLERVFPVVPEA